MNEHEKINYVELPATNLEATRTSLARSLGGHLRTSDPNILHFRIEGLMVVSLNQNYHLQQAAAPH